MVEIEAFGHHLGADQDVDAALREVVDDVFVSVFGACAVEVHALKDRIRKKELQFIFNFLGSEADHAQTVATAIGTGANWRSSVAAIMTLEHIAVLVVGQADIAVLAAGCPGANLTRPNWGIAAAVLKQNDLLFFGERKFHFVE